MGRKETIAKREKTEVWAGRFPISLSEKWHVERRAAGQTKSEFIEARMLATTSTIQVDGQSISQEEIERRLEIIAISEQLKREYETVQRQKMSTLNRIGNNLNQVARRAHISYENQQLSSDKYVELIEELVIIEKLVRNVL